MLVCFWNDLGIALEYHNLSGFLKKTKQNCDIQDLFLLGGGGRDGSDEVG